MIKTIKYTSATILSFVAFILLVCECDDLAFFLLTKCFGFGLAYMVALILDCDPWPWKKTEPWK